MPTHAALRKRPRGKLDATLAGLGSLLVPPPRRPPLEGLEDDVASILPALRGRLSTGATSVDDGASSQATAGDADWRPAPLSRKSSSHSTEATSPLQRLSSSQDIGCDDPQLVHARSLANDDADAVLYQASLLSTATSFEPLAALIVSLTEHRRVVATLRAAGRLPLLVRGLAAFPTPFLLRSGDGAYAYVTVVTYLMARVPPHLLATGPLLDALCAVATGRDVSSTQRSRDGDGTSLSGPSRAHWSRTARNTATPLATSNTASLCGASAKMATDKLLQRSVSFADVIPDAPVAARALSVMTQLLLAENQATDETMEDEGAAVAGRQVTTATGSGAVRYSRCVEVLASCLTSAPSPTPLAAPLGILQFLEVVTCLPGASEAMPRPTAAALLDRANVIAVESAARFTRVPWLKLAVNLTSMHADLIAFSEDFRVASCAGALVALIEPPDQEEEIISLACCLAVNLIRSVEARDRQTASDALRQNLVSRQSFLQSLVSHLSRRRGASPPAEDADEEQRQHFVAGQVVAAYAALLLGLLSVHHEASRVAVMTALAHHWHADRAFQFSSDQPLRVVAAVLQEFILFQSSSGVLTAEMLVVLHSVVGRLVLENGLVVATSKK